MHRPTVATCAALLTAAVLAVPAPAAQQAANGKLEATLAGIRSEELCADVRFLADDQLEGRDSPSRGQRVAARYIRARLARLGWEPGAREGYLQPYELPVQALDAEASGVTVTGDGADLRFEHGRDYFITSYGLSDLEVEAPVVFCGPGELASLERVEFDGAWALVLDPGMEYRDVLRLIYLLRRLGAGGLLLVPGAEYEREDYAKRLAASTDAVRDGILERRRSRSFPTLYLSRSAGRSLQRLAGMGAEGVEVGGVLPITLHEVRRLATARSIELENVCGFWPGSDPELAGETIVLSAHYDHLGVDQAGEIYNGADDNGSGCSVLLGVAEALARHGPLRRSVLLLWVSGEEKGLLGSSAWTLDAWLPGGSRPICNLNLDMVGRNEPQKLQVTPSRTHEAHNGLVAVAERNAPLEGFPRLESCDDYWQRSDHVNFSTNLKIPVAFLFADVHDDYHQPSDTAEKIDCDKVRRVTRLVVRILGELQGDVLDL